MSRYRKTISAVVIGLIGWATAVVASDPSAVTATEWILGATALATALGVYSVPNDPPAGQPADAGVSERGAIDVTDVLVLVVIVLVILYLAQRI